jgi:hypothetical protein
MGSGPLAAQPAMMPPRRMEMLLCDRLSPTSRGEGEVCSSPFSARIAITFLFVLPDDLVQGVVTAAASLIDVTITSL